MEIVTTNTKDGIILHGQLFESPNKENLIIHIHGMSGDLYLNSFYPAMEKNYPENGWSFLATENRGTHSITQFNTTDGRCINIGNAYEKFEDCVYDIQAWIDKAKELGYKRIWLQAHSLGPSKVSYYMTNTPDNDVEGLVWLSPSDMLGLVKDPEGSKDHSICFEQAREFVDNNEGERLLNHLLWGCYKLSANTYLNFFEDGANTGIFNYKGDLGWDVVNKINVPVIAFTGTKDEGVAPVIDAYEGMKILESQLINSPKKETHVYENGVHDFTGFGEDITKRVLNFIQNK